jgi:hypothetical protein
MSYVAHVVVVFPPDPTDSAILDVWENFLIFAAENPRKAIERAIALTKAVLDDDSNCRALGYPSRPVLYGVRDLATDDVLPQSPPTTHEGCRILTKQRSISRLDFERLRSFNEISIPLTIIHRD